MGNGSFTLDWVVKATDTWIIHYMAIGGPDVTNVAVGDFTPTKSTALPAGRSNQRGPGIPAQLPDVPFVDSNTANATLSPHAATQLGLRRASGNAITQGAITVASRSNVGDVNTSEQRADRAILEKNGRLSQLTFEASVKSFDPADSRSRSTRTHACWTLLLDAETPWMGASPSPTKRWCITLALGEGPTRWVLSPSQRTQPYDDDQAKYRVGFQPSGLVFFASNRGIAPSYQLHARLSFSAADAESTPNQRATFFEDHLMRTATATGHG
jgi:hypothetical protein